jgi:hypothetical protein
MQRKEEKERKRVTENKQKVQIKNISLRKRERQRRKDEHRVSLMRERKNGKSTFLAEGLHSIFSMQLI